MLSEREKIQQSRNEIEVFATYHDLPGGEVALLILQDMHQSRIHKKAALVVRVNSLIEKDRAFDNK